METTNSLLFTEITSEEAAQIQGGGWLKDRFKQWVMGPHPYLSKFFSQVGTRLISRVF